MEHFSNSVVGGPNTISPRAGMSWAVWGEVENAPGTLYGNDREVYHGAGNVVDVVGQDIERDQRGHFDDLGIVQAGCTGRSQIRVADLAAAQGDLARQRGNRAAAALARSGDGIRRQAGALAHQGVGRQAVSAPVDLADGEGDAFSLRWAQRTVLQCAVQLQVAGQGVGGMGKRAEQIGHHAQLCLGVLQYGLCGGAGLVEGEGGDTGHDGVFRKCVLNCTRRILRLRLSVLIAFRPRFQSNRLVQAGPANRVPGEATRPFSRCAPTRRLASILPCC